MDDAAKSTDKLPPGMVLVLVMQMFWGRSDSYEFGVRVLMGSHVKCVLTGELGLNQGNARRQRPSLLARSTPSSKFGATAGAAAASASHASETDRAECPVDVEQLGRATWTFLHTAAAYYPVKPSPSQRSNMLALLNSLPVTYPCSHCASHLGENMKAHPPEVGGRDASEPLAL
ncbi:hypothetical protein BS47DRAFT_1151178 [Hydnum rufescens UP504]|uniref:Sulfhydryl oxidase n=1 Tax=Hydnum rufescens UP504 TaxID=1448309 RepID=A0A9P6B8P1_9AGAM|nr:hypothetical protein BS47DRAFT_1151178 [Hydnum rufescens UP504]